MCWWKRQPYNNHTERRHFRLPIFVHIPVANVFTKRTTTFAMILWIMATVIENRFTVAFMQYEACLFACLFMFPKWCSIKRLLLRRTIFESSNFAAIWNLDFSCTRNIFYFFWAIGAIPSLALCRPFFPKKRLNQIAK